MRIAGRDTGRYGLMMGSGFENLLARIYTGRRPNLLRRHTSLDLLEPVMHFQA
jgi:hypothetical protein